METGEATLISRELAGSYAEWFRALSDPTRVQILHLLAVAGGPVTVGRITAAVGVGQSTVSHHLKILAETCFVHVERRGTSSLYRVNDRCIDCFPSAADVVMGRRPVPFAELGEAC